MKWLWATAILWVVGLLLLLVPDCWAKPPKTFVDPDGKVWKIRLIPRANIPDKADGFTVVKALEIDIAQEDDLDDMHEVILHEVMHACLGTEASNDDITVHDFIYRLSPKLAAVFQRNKKLARYLSSH